MKAATYVHSNAVVRQLDPLQLQVRYFCLLQQKYAMILNNYSSLHSSVNHKGNQRRVKDRQR